MAELEEQLRLAEKNKQDIENFKPGSAAEASTKSGGLLDVAARIETLKEAIASLKIEGPSKAGNPAHYAGGGPIHGPGGSKDDTAGLFALSNGEFVMQTAAVQKYGVDLFNSLNSMSFGGFAMGGLVPSTPSAMSLAGAGGPGKASSILNLTIDGNHFNGLTAPDHVAAKLKTYAVSRQTSAVGRSPSWMR